MCRSETSILLLLGLTSSVCGLSQLQAAEGANTSLQWDCPPRIERSSLIAYCFLRWAPQRMVLEIAGGAGRTGHRQFSGRVEWDTEALDEGHVRVLLRDLSLQDAGLYWCYMFANYDRDEGRWTCVTSEYFMLNVTRSVLVTADDRPGRARGGHSVQKKSHLLQKIILFPMFGFMISLASCIAVFALCHRFGFFRTKENILIPV